MPELGLARENIVFVSGIGCSSRFPYYMNTYGMHSIHGRAPAIATGLATSRRDLSRVGRHRRRRRAVHRRQPPHPRPAPQRQPQDPALQQPDLRPDQGPVLAHLARSARSPSRRPWARSTHPSTRVSLALGAEASFVARTVDSDRKHLTSVLRAAAAHPGTALVEIYQNCNIFNDGAFEVLKDRQQAEEAVIRLEHGAADPLRRRRRQGRRTGPADRRPERRRRHRRQRGRRSSSTTPTPPPRPPPSRSPGSPTPTPSTTPPSASSATSNGPSTTPRWPTSSTPPIDQNGKGDLGALLAGSDTWTVVG